MKRNPTPKFYPADRFDNINGFHISRNLIREKYNIHQHEYFELEYIIEGEGTHVLNGEKSHIKKGDVIFVTPMDRHGFESCYIRTYTVHFSSVALSVPFRNALSMMGDRIIKNASSVAGRYFEIAHTMFLDEGAQYKDIKMKNLVELILLELMGDIFSQKDVSPAIKDRLDEAIGYINVNFTKEITLSDIERLYGFSSSYFSHVFKKRVGKTYVSYLCEKRIEYAKKLLASGERVIDACYECGFSSERNFARCFKRSEGITPGEYAARKVREKSERILTK